jgi:hypothetical protein
MSDDGNHVMDIETKRIKSAKDWRVCKKAYILATETFHISKQVAFRRKILSDRSDKEVFAFCMCEFEGSMASCS